MASLDFDAESLSPKPTAYTLPFPALARISIAVLQLCTNNHSPRQLVADRIWLLTFQGAGVW
jgi:uncharacterized caspase-like protein